VITSFGNSETEKLFREERSRRFASIARVAARKLVQLNRARLLTDLSVPPGNRLEALRGRGSGWHSIRINDQWRIIFKWTDAGPEKVEIVDYH
jgi:proteic killer suppression protein